jgi:histidyl-tRNA synthetase
MCILSLLKMQQELFRMIQPRVLKGFRDSLPSQEIVKKQVIATLEEVFSSFGFVPNDTPVLPYTEGLLGKGGGERLINRSSTL